MKESCERYLQDPESHAAHLAECPSCRSMNRGLELMPDARPRALLPGLPVAPWEGASHRPWAMVVVAGVIVLFAAFALFMAAGVSPLEGFVATFRGLVGRLEVLRRASSIAELLRQAPGTFHLLVLIGFVVVNVLFVLLLRRPPKGYDVTIR
jgi:hypothetical protein